MSLALVSFFAGLLTLAAPCVFTLLPVVVGGAVVRADGDKSSFIARWRRPLVIIGSLVGSVIVFSVLLKGTTALLGVPQLVWQLLSGTLLIALGLHQLFPGLWEHFILATGLSRRAGTLLATSGGGTTLTSEVLTGVALGPVFTSCSPTYALIVAVILPTSFTVGLGYIVLYALGLAVGLFAIAVVGRSLVETFGWLRNPHGWFARGIGLLFIVVGLAVIVGADKSFQAYVLDQTWYQQFLEFESTLG